MPRTLVPLAALLIALAAVLPSARGAGAEPGLPPFCWLLDSEQAAQVSPGRLATLERECAPNMADEPPASAGGDAPSHRQPASALPPGADVPVSNPAQDPGPYTTQSETTIAHCGGTTLAAWNDSGSVTKGTFTGYARSTDGGATWQDRGNIPGPTGSDPVLAVDSGCRFYFSAISTIGGCGGLGVVRSDDGGQTWRPQVNAAHSLPCASFHDKEWMTVDATGGGHDGNVYLCWDDRREDRIDVRFTRSTDGGQTFANSTVLTTFPGGFATGCQVQVAPDGKVHVVWSHGNDLSMRIRTSANGGASFSDTVIISPSIRVGDFGLCGTSPRPLLNGDIRAFNWPGFAVHPTTGSLHVVWNDGRGDGADIMYARSTDGGANWSEPVFINDDATTADQFQPALGFTDDGTMRAFWLDRRLDPVNNYLFDIFSATSTNEGASWGPGERISDVSSGVPPINPNFDPAVTHCYMGDYNQVIGVGDSHFMVWSDNRRTVAGRPDPDVYFDKRSNASLSLTVSRTDDPPPNGCVFGDCSLREAILAANQSTGPDSITVPTGNYTLHIAGRGEDQGQTGDLDIAGDLVLRGAGADVTIVSAQGLDRVFDVRGATNVAINGLTVRGGDNAGQAEGGGIRNAASLTLTAVSVDSNRAPGAGGGIFNSGTLVFQQSIAYANVAATGGGIFNQGTLSVVDATVHGNDAQTTGGIGNTGTASLAGATIAANEAPNGAELRNQAAGTMEMRNTIVAGDLMPACGGTIASLGHNLAGDETCGLNAEGDLPGTDPFLANRGDHGGPTLSVRITSASPAVDAGDLETCSLSDQRGFVRPAGAACDIGAFELDSLPLGDADCNLRTNTLDALAVLQQLAGGAVAPCAVLVADVNCDGALDGVDVLIVLQYLAALPFQRPANCPPFGFG